MDVLLLVLWLLAFVQFPGDVAGQLSAVLPSCFGDTFTFNCTVTGDMNGAIHWKVNNQECLLPHSTVHDRPCWSGSPFRATTGIGFGTSATSYSSTLSGTATSTLDGTLVECFGPDFSRHPGNMVGNRTLQIIGPHIVNISCHYVSESFNGKTNITVSWSQSDGNSVAFYLISITSNAPQPPYGGLLNITTASVTQHELTGFMTGYEYNITVRGICGGQEGSESEPLTITPQVPDVPTDCNCTTLYNQSSDILLIIGSTWNEVKDPVDPCPGISGDITHYQISFQTGSVVDTENVNISECTAGKCSHTFQPPSNPPSSYDSVSVAAENVVGVGAARTCTTQTIHTTNNLLVGEVVDVSSPSDVRLNCTFLSGFTGSAHCTVQYGTDPTYMNLTYSAESTENGTAGDTVSVVLRERLNSSTVYYYTVSAVSGDVTVTVLAGSFTTPLPCLLEFHFFMIGIGAVAQMLSILIISARVMSFCCRKCCKKCNEKESKEPAEKESKEPAKKESKEPAEKESKEPAEKESKEPAEKESKEPAEKESKEPAEKESKEPAEKESKEPTEKDETKLCHMCLIVVAIILFIIGVSLWIAMGVMASRNTCDPYLRDGLLYPAFATSVATLIVAFIFTAAVCYHRKDEVHCTKNKGQSSKSRILWCLIFAVAVLCPGDVTGQFTAAPPTCPGDSFTFRCTIAGDRNGVTIWRVGGGNECTLLHSTHDSHTCGTSSPFTATAGPEFGTSATSFSSTLNGTATSALDNTLVECFGPAFSRNSKNMVGNSTLQILVRPFVSTLSCVELSEDVSSGVVNVTVSWTLSGGDSADFFLINITTNAPETPHGGLLNTTASVTQYELTGFMIGYEYNITVRGVTVNCGGLDSEPLTITPQGPPTVSSLSCVDLSGDINGAVNVTVSWTLNGGGSADFYLINITTNAPQTPYGGLLNIPTASVAQYELTGFMTGYEYGITVHGVNCGSWVGSEGEPLKIKPQVPAVSMSFNITLPYNQSSGQLLFIYSKWDPVPDPVSPCSGVTGNIIQYQIRFQAGSLVLTENVNITSCTAGRCSHTFEPHSNPPSSYDSVSVAAMNVVGVGAAKTHTAQTINTINNLLAAEEVDMIPSNDARLNCTFLSGFTGSARCIVRYGTDPTYMNLPYSAESAETGTAGDTVSVVLRERLNSSTVYYYTVSAVSGDVTVVVRAPPFSTNDPTPFPNVVGGTVGGVVGVLVILAVAVAVAVAVLIKVVRCIRKWKSTYRPEREEAKVTQQQQPSAVSNPNEPKKDRETDV